MRMMRVLSISGMTLTTAAAGLGTSACSSESPSGPQYVMGPVGGTGNSTTGGSSSAGGSTTTGGTGTGGASGASTGGSGNTAGTGGTGGTGGEVTTGGTGGTGGSGTMTRGHFKVLVYHETRAYHHDSISAGMQMLTELAAENDFEVTESDGDETDITGDPQITPEDLAPFDVVFFLSTTGDVFGAPDSPEREVFQTFLKEKRSFVGVHAATDTEHTNAWYEDLVGEIYDLHAPGGSPGTINIEESQLNHPAMAGISSPWTRNEEWYRFLNRIDTGLPGLNILMRYNGTLYTNGPAVGQPLAWTRCWEGIRSFYTAMGHDSSAFSEPDIRKHILGGLLWAAFRVDAPNETCL